MLPPERQLRNHRSRLTPDGATSLQPEPRLPARPDKCGFLLPRNPFQSISVFRSGRASVGLRSISMKVPVARHKCARRYRAIALVRP